MFCYQCEQTANETGCTKMGVCGKDPTAAALQDLLIHGLKGLAVYAHRARTLGKSDSELDLFVLDVLFTTVTNVSFDTARLTAQVTQLGEMKSKALAMYRDACAAAGKEPETFSGPTDWTPGSGMIEMVKQGEAVGIEAMMETQGKDITSLKELLLYGIKGMAAYAHHAQVLGKSDDDVSAYFLEVLSFLTEEHTVDELVAQNLRAGEVNLKIMGLLDEANTGSYGHPEPTAVRITPVKGKAILVSGHDLKDLAALLEQTEGKGINIYTHSEMLPANAYPGLKKYSHLVGNYGGAWQDQRNEFEAFPGSILMTTNCIQRPKKSYNARIFTTGLVSWPGVTHVAGTDFAPVISAALEADGFTEDEPEKTIMTGFGHNAVMGVADKVIDAVKAGAIKHFFLVGGCDGAASGRNYYTELAEKIPDDCVILTLACGKFRFNKMEFGDIGGIPRLLDVGQCNDAYSAVQIAVALAGAFETDVNSLPLSFVVSWFEQKAVCILLSLLHLGIQNIRLGPSLPAFVSPAVLDVLVKNFNLTPVSSAEADLAAMLQG